MGEWRVYGDRGWLLPLVGGRRRRVNVGSVDRVSGEVSRNHNWVSGGGALAKTILSVGFEVPGGGCECVSPLSNRSLLDADIVIFQPDISSTHHYSTYRGKPSLSDDASFRVRESLAHWRRELADALDVGKLVVLLLDTPQVVYAATGNEVYSGTGRNRQTTRIVEPLHAYKAVPTEWR